MIADAAPSVLALTDYDRAYVTTYLRLLDSVTENAPWEDAARALLAIDPHIAPARARRRYNSHLARARWIASQGYWDLLKGT
ncbi:hypothetical protein FQU96_27270 [Reyranella sp. CPCC 100927]|nr:hypothetical protein [Reyranella sp. CPCC 100927]TWT04117.1 hypothetical protein FQU96_27270 [Reyranella sp. CPCC 100927]